MKNFTGNDGGDALTMRVIRVLLMAALVVATASADFSYKQESKLIGGSMAGMMKMMMRMSKSAHEAMVGSTYFKGDKSAVEAGDTVTIYDLGAETITTINKEKRTYSVMTFDEMRQAMARMAEKMSGKQENVDVRYMAEIRDGKKTQDVYGYPAKLAVVIVGMEGTNQKGNSGGMEMVNDMWLSTSIAGSTEMSDFHKRLGEKLAGAMDSNMGMMGAMMKQKGFDQAMDEFRKNSAKLNGVPVLMVMRMGPAGALNAMLAESGTIPQDKPDADSGEKPSMASVLKGMGGFGGFGRKRNDQPAAEPPQGGGSAALMEMETRHFDFSNAPVDDSHFAVPAGYTKVENEMKKMLK
ncbi:MAG: hypothetical protein LC114_09965 [Bryobacterales bacterium]|nr:hypothetical protein [Bryobacterales bacterium]